MGGGQSKQKQVQQALKPSIDTNGKVKLTVTDFDENGKVIRKIAWAGLGQFLYDKIDVTYEGETTTKKVNKTLIDYHGELESLPFGPPLNDSGVFSAGIN